MKKSQICKKKITSRVFLLLARGHTKKPNHKALRSGSRVFFRACYFFFTSMRSVMKPSMVRRVVGLRALLRTVMLFLNFPGMRLVPL